MTNLNRKIVLLTICVLLAIPILFLVFHNEKKAAQVIPLPTEQTKGEVNIEIAKAVKLAEGEPNETNYVNLSLLHINNRQYTQGIEACKKALAINSSSVIALNNMGFSLLMLRRYKESENYLRQALKVKPEFELAKNNLEMLLAQKEKEMASLYELINQCKTNPSFAGFSSLGLKYYTLGMLNESLNAYKEAEKLEPDNADVHNNLCAIYNDLQKWQEAKKQCEKALEIKPGYELAKNNLLVAKNSIK